MSDTQFNEQDAQSTPDVRDIVRQAVEEFVRGEHRKSEPAYKAELHEERKRRESLEMRLNQLVDENKKARAVADEADRNSQIRAELQRLGVSKVELAFRAIKEDIVRAEDGRLQARGPENKSLQDYLSAFVNDNPELLPARIAGGSGAQASSKNTAAGGSGVRFDQIRPDMNKEELDQVRQEISRLANQALRGI